MNNKYNHLKFNIIPKAYKYVLIDEDESNLKKESIIHNILQENEPSAIFIDKNEFSIIVNCDFNIKASILKVESDWCCFKIIGDMPFGTVQGLISKVSVALMKKNIGVCVVSTFKTDFFFIRKKYECEMISLLKEEGWEFTDNEYKI
ncbi:MAG: ACT domain-containing protein [Pseudobdellovibrio sp.]